MPQSPQSDRPKRFVSFFGTGSVKPMWDEIWGVGGSTTDTHGPMALSEHGVYPPTGHFDADNYD